MCKRRTLVVHRRIGTNATNPFTLFFGSRDAYDAFDAENFLSILDRNIPDRTKTMEGEKVFHPENTFLNSPCGTAYNECVCLLEIEGVNEAEVSGQSGEA